MSETPIPVPLHTRTIRMDAVRVGDSELEDFGRKELRLRVAAPDAEGPSPVDGATHARDVLATDMHAEALLVDPDHGAGVREPFDRSYELVSMPCILRVEVECGRMAQIALGDQVGEHHQLVARPALAPQHRQAPGGGDRVANLQLAELAPARHGEKRVLGRGIDLPAERGTQTEDLLATAMLDREDALSVDAQLGTARQCVP